MMELNEIKSMLESNNVELSDLDNVLSVAICSACCAASSGGNSKQTQR